MADEVLKFITTAEVGPLVAAFKQIEQAADRIVGSTKTAATSASQAFGKMKEELLSGPKQALEGLKKAVDEQRTAFTAAKPSAEEYAKTLKDAGKNLGDLGRSLTVGLTIPLTAAAAAFIATGVSFDAAFDKIRGRTGATGTALESLKDSFRTVFASVPQNADQVSSVLVSLNQRLGLTGNSLEALAKTELDLARVTGENVQGIVIATTRAFENWQIATAEQIPTLDTLLKVSQATGIGVTQLAESVGKFGPQFRAIGFNFTEAAVMVGKFEKEGINAEQLIRGINKAVVELGKRGQSPKEVFQGLIDGIKALDEQKAIDLASKFFGTRGAVTLVDAVRSGRFEIDELVKTIQASSETVKKAGDDTLSFADKFDILKNRVQLALEPLGTSLLNVLEKQVFPIIEGGIDKLKSLADGFGRLPEPVQAFAFSVGGLLAILGPTIGGLGFMLDGISKFVGFLPSATALLTAGGGFLPAIVLGTILLGGFAVAYAEIGRQQNTNEELRKTVDLVQRLSGVAKQAGITPDQFSALRAAAEREASQLGSTKNADQLFEEKVNAASAARKTAGSAGGLVPISLSPTAKASTTRPGGGFIPPPIKLGAAAKEIDPFKFDKDFRSGELKIFQDFDKAGDQFDKNWTARLKGTADLSLKEFENHEKAANEILKQNGEIRVASAVTEYDRIMAQHELDRNSFLESELFKTAIAEQQGALRANFEELFQAQQDARRRGRIKSLDDEFELLTASTSGGQGPQARQREQLSALTIKQAHEYRDALERIQPGAEGEAELQKLQRNQGLELIKLQQNQYDEMFDKVQNRAEGVFDAIFLRGKKGFAGLLDYVKGVFAVQLKEEFGKAVATIFLGPRPGKAGGSEGIFGQLFGGIGGGKGILGALGIGKKDGEAAQIAGAVKSGVSQASQAAAAASCACFERGIESIAKAPAAAGGSIIPGLAGLGGLGALLGFGGKSASAAGSIGQSTVKLTTESGEIIGGLGSAGGAADLAGLGAGGIGAFGGAGASAGELALPTTFTNTGLLPGTAAGSGGAGGLAGFAGSGLGGALIGGGAGFGGGFGLGKLLGIGGNRSAIAGGVGAAAGIIASAFLGPIGGALVGAGVGALTAGVLRLFGGQAREIKFQKEIERDFGLLIKDGKLLKQIKTAGESAFGKDADKKRFETLRLNDVQSLLLNYATASGQDPSRLPIHQKFYGAGLGTAARSLSFDPSRGVPAFGNGGIVTGPTLGLLGDRGPEAILPLPLTNAQGLGAQGGVSIQYSPTINIPGGVSMTREEFGRMLDLERRKVVEVVDKAFSGDYRRQNILSGLMGT